MLQAERASWDSGLPQITKLGKTAKHGRRKSKTAEQEYPPQRRIGTIIVQSAPSPHAAEKSGEMRDILNRSRNASDVQSNRGSLYTAPSNNLTTGNKQAHQETRSEGRVCAPTAQLEKIILKKNRKRRRRNSI